MRVIFSALALLVVLAVVGFSAMKQLQPAHGVAAVDGAASEAGLPTVPVIHTPAQARQVQEQVRADLEKALQRSAARNEEPAP